jgi:hypothetical protein
MDPQQEQPLLVHHAVRKSSQLSVHWQLLPLLLVL